MSNDKNSEYKQRKENSMKSPEMIREIRRELGLSQCEFGQKLGVCFATVNRWEKGRCEPSQIAVSAIKMLCKENGIDFSRFDDLSEVVSDEVITLYHGTRKVLDGKITPKSHCHCDFGSGFYMYDSPLTAKTLICGSGEAKLYTLSLSLSELKILDFDVLMDWVFFVGYNRGKLDFCTDSAVYKRMSGLSLGYDLLIGAAVDEKTAVALDRFFDGEITDAALIKCLPSCDTAVKQFVALTQKAADNIKILSEETLSSDERLGLCSSNIESRKKAVDSLDEIWRENRRNGRFFDEIIGGGKS